MRKISIVPSMAVYRQEAIIYTNQCQNVFDDERDLLGEPSPIPASQVEKCSRLVSNAGDRSFGHYFNAIQPPFCAHPEMDQHHDGMPPAIPPGASMLLRL